MQTTDSTTLDAVRQIWVDDGNDVEHFDDAYVGCFDTFRDFADDTADEFMPSDAPDFLMRYFDYAAFARDLEYDYWTITDPETYMVHIFRTNY